MRIWMRIWIWMNGRTVGCWKITMVKMISYFWKVGKSRHVASLRAFDSIRVHHRFWDTAGGISNHGIIGGADGISNFFQIYKHTYIYLQHHHHHHHSSLYPYMSECIQIFLTMEYIR